jgi:hypothetical protein
MRRPDQGGVPAVVERVDERQDGRGGRHDDAVTGGAGDVDPGGQHVRVDVAQARLEVVGDGAVGGDAGPAGEVAGAQRLGHAFGSVSEGADGFVEQVPDDLVGEDCGCGWRFGQHG